jgi:type VI secretion system protein VasG
MGVSLKAIVARLNSITRAALEGAAGLCMARAHYDVEIEHLLLKLLDVADSDFARILHHFGVNKGRLSADLARALDKLKSGNARTPAFSPSLFRLLVDTWSLASLEYGATEIRTGYLILALAAKDSDNRRSSGDISEELSKIEASELRRQLPAILAKSPERPAEAAEAPAERPARTGNTPNLDQYTVDLTDAARRGKIDPVLGRDAEIRQIIDILTRRRQNNPILTGEAGVGKTAVVEGFASRIVQGDVPPVLRNVTVRTLDLALLQAGAGVRGEFENRLKGLIEEVKASPAPIILFIDEAHTIIGSGGAAGQNDAANLLKPALARGELRTIAATTWSEYKKYFEKDAALARRFQVVKVDEPTEAACQVMLRGVAATLEKHHKVRILDEGLAAAVKLTHRYLPDRQLPDKAVSVLDTACARVSLAQNATPPPMEDVTREIQDCAVQLRILERESAVGVDHNERLGAVARQKAAAEGRLAELAARIDQERALVDRIREARAKLENSVGAQSEIPSASNVSHAGTAPALAAAHMPLADELAAATAELQALQGEAPLIRVCVDANVVGDVVSAWTGIPIGRMLKDEVGTVLSLETHLGRRVVGQDHALAMVSERIRTSKAGLEDPSKPIGVFLLVGPSGVGKTETALALAELMYGGERNLITINMSEFQEAHTVSTLKGSPPGYVGYGEGGVLTEAVRRRPYSVVLLDEAEKAHPDVLELFFQVFDKGKLEDGEGREIDFKNTIIILTSNAATDLMMRLTADPESAPEAAALVSQLKPALNKVFKPAFLGRLVIIPYLPIDGETLRQIIQLKLASIQRRIEEAHRVALTYDDAVLEEIADRCTEVESGARNIDNILTNTVLPAVARRILGRLGERQKPAPIHVRVSEDGEFLYDDAAEAV